MNCLDISSKICIVAVCLIPLSHYLCSMTGHLTPKLMWYARIQHSLLNVAIYIPCINMHHTGHYQLEMIFKHAHISPIAMSNALHGSDCLCSKIEVYVANSGLISNTCMVISTWQNLCIKIFCEAPTKIYLHIHLAHEYCFTQKFPNLWYMHQLIAVVFMFTFTVK